MLWGVISFVWRCRTVPSLVTFVLSTAVLSCASPPIRVDPPASDPTSLSTTEAPTTDVSAAPFRTLPLDTERPCNDQEPRPSRVGFFDEVLFPAASPKTPRFDGHSTGSYQPTKRDLASGLLQRAVYCDVLLRAVLVVGPGVPLSTYHIIAFIQEASSIRVSALTVPHGRLTRKSTGVFDESLALAFLNQTEELLENAAPPHDLAEFSYGLLFVRYRKTDPEYVHATFDSQADEELFFDHVNSIFKTLEQTYPLDE